MLITLKVMLHGTINNDDFQRNTALQHCCYIGLNGCNIVSTFEPCVALKIVVSSRVTSPLGLERLNQLSVSAYQTKPSSYVIRKDKTNFWRNHIIM